MISCSNLYQDLTSTTVELTPEFISHVRNTTTGDNNYIFAKLTCGRKTIIKKIDISEQTAANGAVLTFDNLIVGKKGSVYIAVANDETVEGFKSETVASIEGTTKFTVQPNNQTKIKVSLNPATKYTAEFITFNEVDNKTTVNYPVITFTESSIITAPLPVGTGTTRWQIYFNNEGNISYHGSFGEKIDVAKDLIQYKEYFKNLVTGNNDTVYFEATGNPMNKINTPIVYCEKGSNEEDGSSTYKILGSNTPVLSPTIEIRDYCFDNAGNLYFSTLGGIFKVAYNHKENIYEENQDNFSNIGFGKLSYDKAQNYLYVCSNYLGDTPHLTRIQNPAGGIYKDFNRQNPTSFKWDEYPLERGDNDIADPSFTVHDGILYVSKIQKTEQGDSGKYSYSLVLQKGSIESGTFEDTTIEYEILSDAQYSLSGTTDIMYQDGSLYIIFSCYNTSWNNDNNYSTGGILEYNIESNSFGESEIKGFAPNNSKKINATEEHNISFYAPTNETESTSFYGPTKFVAIMPKKLVFLDQGASIGDYSFGTGNTQEIPTKSRIVEYDLSTNSFSSTKITGTDLYISFAFTM